VRLENTDQIQREGPRKTDQILLRLRPRDLSIQVRLRPNETDQIQLWLRPGDLSDSGEVID